MKHHSDVQNSHSGHTYVPPSVVCDSLNLSTCHLRSVPASQKRLPSVNPIAMPLRQSYHCALKLIGQAHHQLLCVIKDELDQRGVRAINNVQAMLLLNFEDEVLRVSDLRAQGRYVGSNVTYNVQKLVDAGYVRRESSEVDRRVVLLQLTPKGRELNGMLSEMFDHHADRFESIAEVSRDDVLAMNDGLKRLDSFWRDQIRFRL